MSAGYDLLKEFAEKFGRDAVALSHYVLGAEETVPHLTHDHPAVRDVNEEFDDSFTRLERIAIVVTNKVGSFGFFLAILVWSILWLGWNTLAPHGVRFDPAPAFVLWLFISNLLQILLMPLIMVGQNLQGRHSELRAQSDFEVNVKAEREVEAILLHLEAQSAQIQRQGELILEILKHMRAGEATSPAPDERH